MYIQYVYIYIYIYSEVWPDSRGWQGSRRQARDSDQAAKTIINMRCKAPTQGPLL